MLLKLFRRVVYAEDEDSLTVNLEDLHSNPIALKYPQFLFHLKQHTLPKIEQWCLAKRIKSSLPTSSQNTNNLVEASFRFTKEIQFNRVKAFNLPDLLSILLDNSEFYADKCTDAGNNVLS